jgi:hypothetical protein
LFERGGKWEAVILGKGKKIVNGYCLERKENRKQILFGKEGK